MTATKTIHGVNSPSDAGASKPIDTDWVDLSWGERSNGAIGGLRVRYGTDWSSAHLWDGHNLHHIVDRTLGERWRVGVLLAEHALALKQAGLGRITISLDSLDPGRFERLTRRKSHAAVLEGIEAAREAGFRWNEPVQGAWTRLLSERQLQAMALPFPVVPVAS